MRLLIYAAPLIFLLCHISAYADESPTEQMVAKIESTAQVKKKLRELMLEEAGTGSVADAIAANICSYVAALDAKVDYQIINSLEHGGQPKPEIPISAKDIKLMKLIYSQCKPTNYQYWLWNSMLHVSYYPTPEIDATVRAALGLNKATGSSLAR